VKSGKTEQLFSVDEEPGNLKPDKVDALKPSFDPAGTVTAANASSLSDGAAALLLCSESYVKRRGIKPLTVLVEHGWHGQEPEWFTTAPIGAIERVLERAKLKISDIDLFEINEAFSAVALACERALEIDSSKLNVCGGAVALGHPIGASGARILVTLAHSLERLKLKRGLAAICNGGGEATSVIIERV
jgi:acetyl-CoA C-acetyltransferase